MKKTKQSNNLSEHPPELGKWQRPVTCTREKGSLTSGLKAQTALKKTGRMVAKKRVKAKKSPTRSSIQ